MNYKFPYIYDFPNQQKISLLEKACDDFFSDHTKKIGYNKQGDKCIRGFYIHVYADKHVDFIPVILYSNKIVHDIDFKRLGISKEHSEKYYEKFYRLDNPLRSLEKCFYILHDGKKYHEIMIDLTKHVIREKLVEKLNYLFFIAPFQEKLEHCLDNKSHNKKIKI